MTLSEKFEKETGLASAMYVNLNLPPVPTHEYVEWLEAKVQETPPSESLKEAAKEWATKEVIEYYYPTVTRAFIAGAEWAMQNAQKPEVDLSNLEAEVKTFLESGTVSGQGIGFTENEWPVITRWMAEFAAYCQQVQKPEADAAKAPEECYKYGGICRHNCPGQCRESC